MNLLLKVLVMALRRIKLGELLEQSDERNTKEAFGLDSIRGISTQKVFIDTKANMDGVSLKGYKIVPPNCFSYVPDTSRRGDKISIAFNNSKETYLVSSISIVFKVKSELIDPWYLFMFFNRPEFDRYSRYHSFGSAREPFNWEDMCGIEIELPDLKTQKKFVNVYLGMLENQKAYEAGLDNLKFTYEAIIDEFKHEAAKKTMGNIFKEIDNRNVDGSISEVKGIDISKRFMPSVANMLNVDLAKYKIVNKRQFAFSGMQTGRDRCIRIALLENDEPIVISPAYTVLQIVDDSCLPKYVMMWFSRKEIDRLGWFMSDASIRTNLDMDRFCEIEIPVPSLNAQKSLVAIFDAYNIRVEINEKLKHQISDICPILIKGSIEEAKEA